MRLIIDMDGVLVDLANPLLAIYNREKGTSIKLEDIIQYDLSIYPGMSDIFKRPGFFRKLKPFPGALEALRELHEAGHEIVIASNHMQIHHIWREKYDWLLDNVKGVTYSPYFTDRKDNLCGDLILDDCPAYLEAFPGITVCMDCPWNRGVEVDHVDYRVSDMREFVELIKRMEAMKCSAATPPCSGAVTA